MEVSSNQSFDKKNSLIQLTLIVALLISLLYVGRRIYLSTQAEEISIPGGMTALEYIQNLQRADQNHDGVINVLDYARLLANYGKGYKTTDFSSSAKLTAKDSAFMISEFGTNVNKRVEKLQALSNVAKSVTEQKVKDSEDFVPLNLAGKIEVTSNSDAPLAGDTADSPAGSASGGSDKESFGRTVVPSVLGTVSNYTGGSAFSFDFNLPAGLGGFAPSLGLSYSSDSVDDMRVQDPLFYLTKDMPTQWGIGFNLSGLGAITRDTKGEKDILAIKDQFHHSFILSIPGGVSAELRLNTKTHQWTTSPQAFLDIQHNGGDENKMLVADGTDKDAFKLLDGDQWIITTKDGTKYFFGEPNLRAKLDGEGKIIGSTPFARASSDEIAGTQGGNLYNEFDKSHLCVGSSNDPCEERGDKVLMTNKWLLRKIQTPDGKSIEYEYDVHQRKLESPFTKNVSYITSDTYPKTVYYNDGKHKVDFITEDRPVDDRGPKDFMKSRIKEVIVSTKTQATGAYEKVRSYALSYYNGNEQGDKNNNGYTDIVENLGVDPSGEPIENPDKSSFLTQIQEFGKNGNTLPPVRFSYTQIDHDVNHPNRSNSIYLSTIDNGYGGQTKFLYEGFKVTAQNNTAGFKGQTLMRARVIEKTVVDHTKGAKSFKETYAYGSPKAYQNNFRTTKFDDGTGNTVSAVVAQESEFLGHDSIDIKTFDFNSDKLLKHAKVNFYQDNETASCFEPHPAKGQVKEQIAYDTTGKEVSKSQNTFKLRFVEGKEDIDTCQPDRYRQPYFVYQDKTRTTTTDTIADSEKNALIPDKFKSAITEPIKTSATTLTQNLSYDLVGNLEKSVSYGEVDSQDKDLDPKDTRYSFSYFLVNTPKWIKGLPYLSYTSNKSSCALDDLSCQWGRKEMWYDIFDKVDGKDYDGFVSADARASLVKFGLPTQSEAYLSNNNDEKVISGMTYSATADDATQPKYAGVYQTFGTKPNTKKADKKDLIEISQIDYDPYYHTLVMQKENALGHKEKYEDYDVLLQLPRKIKKQTQKSPEKYAVTTMTFDEFGRLSSTFAPDPEQPDKSLLVPATLTHYFMPNYSRPMPDNAKLSDATKKVSASVDGMVTRTVTLASQTKDGGFHFMAQDSFYDGIGNVIQSQNLITPIYDEASKKSVEKRTVQNSQFNADGTSSESYQVELADAVTGVEPATIDKVAPQYVDVASPKITAQVEYDSLRRPVTQKTIDPTEGTTFTTKTQYFLNGTKTTDQKGVQSLSVADSLGRVVNTLAYHPDSKDSMVSTNTYGQEMVDKPTLTTMQDQNGKKVVTGPIVYDRSGRVMETTEPSLGSTKFTYDLLGNALTQINAPREQIILSYDSLGRVVKKQYEKAGSQPLYKKLFGGGQDTITFTYDDAENGLGKLSQVTDLSGSESYTYDPGQRTLKTTKKIADVTHDFTSSFNKLSQVLSATYPDSTKVTYEYDKFGVQQKMFVNGSPVVNGIQFDKFGNTINTDISYNGKNYANKSRYDDLGRIHDLSVDQINDKGEKTSSLFSQSLKYNPLGEISNLTESVNGKNNTYAYTYDNYSQLTAVDSNLFKSSYTYDAFGRITYKNEKEEVLYNYSDSFPFFAPKNVAINLKAETIDRGTTVPAPSGPIISGIPPLPTGVKLPPQQPAPQTKAASKTAVLGDQAGLPITYTERGAMTQDQESCYTYNIEGQLIELFVKKTQSQKCGLDSNQYKRSFAFYYDYAGTLVMQEIYDPGATKPSKTTYFFGNYEEER